MDTNILLGLLNLSYNTFIIPDFRIKVKHNLYNNGMNGTLFGLLKTTLFWKPSENHPVLWHGPLMRGQHGTHSGVTI
jgi:hypothetical protein